MIRIAHLTSVHQRFDTRIFLKQCKSLVNNGYDVSLIVADGNGNENKVNIKIYDVGKPKNRIFRMLNTTRQVYKKAIKLNADVYHLHDPELIPVGVLLKKKGKIVVYDAHEDLPLQTLSKPYLNVLLRKTFSGLTNHYLKFACSKFNAIVAATPVIEEKFKAISKKVVNINNFPMLEEFCNASTDWSSKNKQVCYIGGFSAVRGIREIVSAIALVKGEVRLVLGGYFNEPGLDLLVKSLPGWSFVDEMGFLGRDGVSKLLSDSYAGLVTLQPTPNYIDSLPVKMFEYMAAGLPVIASNFPLWKEIIEFHNCGICVDPTKPEEIATAIDFLIDNPELAKEMGENGKRAVNEKFNWKAEEKKLFDLYESLSK